MSSIVCQGLQSCLENAELRLLRLKLAPPVTVFTEPYNEETNTTITKNMNGCKPIANRNVEMGGWTFLRSLSEAKAVTEKDKVYVHPLVKRSGSRLSEKSLEMCTERLGSETGSEVSDCSNEISLLSLETQTVSSDVIPSKPRECSPTGKTSRSNSFPPPLTSISSSNGVRVKSSRENGRLVLEAVSFPHCRSYFHAERSDGRLRLSLLKDTTLVLGGEEGEEVEVEEDEFYGETENNEGNNGNVGGEIGTGKLPRPSSCKESGCGHKGSLLNWKPFLLAT